MPNHVLVIDDEERLRQAMTMRLSAAGFEVRTAPDGPSGIEAARADAPSVLVLDLRMPGMDGFEVLRRIKADPATASIAVLVLSAHAQSATRRQVLAHGASRFLSKPYELSDLIAALNHCRSQEATAPATS